MKTLIDALGAPRDSGGMRLYTEELIKAWASRYPEDQLIVVGGPWIASAFEGIASVLPVVRRERPTSRVLGQWIGVAVQARSASVDAVLSVSPVVSPLVGGRPRVCVVHDWRHLNRPEEFGKIQRTYRGLWAWSVNRATCAIQISSKTDRETAVIAPRAQRIVIRNGQDHARGWPVVNWDEGGPSTVVTYGHHTNKRPDLVIRAMARIDSKSASRLVVLGASGEYAMGLRTLAHHLGIGDRVEFPGFVHQRTYQQVIQRASVIVIASTDEGFGLPVSEGAHFGIPVVSTDDNGLDTIHGDRVTCVRPTPEDLGRGISEALLAGRSTVRDGGNTWDEAAVAVRAVVRAGVHEARSSDRWRTDVLSARRLRSK